MSSVAALAHPAATADRLRRAVRRYGVKGTLREAGRLARTYRGRRRWERLDREFDARYGVDTAGIVRLHDLTFESENKQLGNRYEATTPDGFRALLGGLDVGDHEQIFIDLGSGKGRALLLASEFPFKRVVGVEFSPELHEVAERNVERFDSPEQRCREFDLVCMDAARYELPDEPTLLYIYNAFEEPVMRAVLENVRRSLETSPRPLTMVIANRHYSLDALAAAGFVPVDDGAGEVFAFQPTVASRA